MNLIDMFRRKDPCLEVNAQVNVKMTRWDGKKWRTLEVHPSGGPQIVLRDIAEVHALKSGRANLGWYAIGPDGSELAVTVVGDSGPFSSKLPLSRTPTPVVLPSPRNLTDFGTMQEIRLHFLLPAEGVAELYVQQVLYRESVYDLAKGRGVEIGPGPRPQIHQSEHVDVTYVEEKTGDYWASVYDHDGKRGAAQANWSKYHVGQASELPAEDGSLDFVFSSHVFEHLANPIGHLLHWKAKLKKGGVILAIVPNMDCTKDWCASPSKVGDLRQELVDDIWSPNIGHYQRFAAIRGKSGSGERLMEEGKSIHVHFYDEQGIRNLLEECVTSFGFSSYEVIFSPNHKDFYYALWT